MFSPKWGTFAFIGNIFLFPAAEFPLHYVTHKNKHSTLRPGLISYHHCDVWLFSRSSRAAQSSTTHDRSSASSSCRSFPCTFQRKTRGSPLHQPPHWHFGFILETLSSCQAEVALCAPICLQSCRSSVPVPLPAILSADFALPNTGGLLLIFPDWLEQQIFLIFRSTSKRQLLSFCCSGQLQEEENT